MEELSAHSHLKDDINIGGILETAVHLDYVGMVEKHLDLHLPQKLLSYLLFLQ